MRWGLIFTLMGAVRTLCFSTNNPQSTENFALNLGIPLRITILHIVSKSQVEGHNGSAVSDARMTSCFVDFDQRLRVYGKRCHGRSF